MDIDKDICRKNWIYWINLSLVKCPLFQINLMYQENYTTKMKLDMSTKTSESTHHIGNSMYEYLIHFYTLSLI